MMSKKRKVILFIASSLDGYIATKDESLEWLFNVDGERDNGLSDFYKTIDTVVMGKKSYDWVMKQDLEEFPYKDKECYVFTRSCTQDAENVKFVNEDITIFTKNLMKQEGKNIWIVGGGRLLHFFIQRKLVDVLIITIALNIF